MLKSRHAKVKETILLEETYLENIKVKPPSATPVAPGVGAKYIIKVTNN